ncbi:hypothetical protein FMV2238Y02_00300 [Streptococcus canis]|uniref:V-type ATP synthase subunit G n=1 Tax=Streptococcus canis TaxID=1329 RepID=A0A3P5XM28_STRCB|nr:hypothetical protein [Streptococcus canis]MDV5972352.1 hypothetical protein [Streptococcus canis]MDW7796226.1 hypothetical protein [Streptococcus canis]QKG78603.1 hypothetical protein GE021_000990 [Streptococcus canis]VDC41543.1 hypothetical protein FMV2238Y02_00300 [Streptococcus canis]
MNTMLSLMSSIEQEAKDIYDSYDAKKKALADQKEATLNELFSVYEQETQALLQEERDKFLATHHQEKEVSQESISKQRVALHTMMTEKKPALVTEIVDKVVEIYGH